MRRRSARQDGRGRGFRHPNFATNGVVDSIGRGAYPSRLIAEFVGTALLLLAIVGSGITASTGAGPDRLFEHAIVVGLALGVLIAALGGVSGGHFNPVVTVVAALLGDLNARLATGYITVQLLGALIGVATTHVLFGLPSLGTATTVRTGLPLLASEGVATFGLVLVIWGVRGSGNGSLVPAAVGGWIAGAIYFTSSTGFANPAVTLGRTLTDTFTGIVPANVPGFVGAQLVGALAAAALIACLLRPSRPSEPPPTSSFDGTMSLNGMSLEVDEP